MTVVLLLVGPGEHSSSLDQNCPEGRRRAVWWWWWSSSLHRLRDGIHSSNSLEWNGGYGCRGNFDRLGDKQITSVAMTASDMAQQDIVRTDDDDDILLV